MARGRHYRIGELAKLAGVSPRTVDYYTQLGLLEPTKRSNGNYRLYDDDTRELLCRIRALQERRVPLAEIRERVAAARAGHDSLARLDHLEELVRGLEREVAEIAAARPHLRAECARDDQARLAVTRMAGEVLQQALALSYALTSLVDESRLNQLPV